MQRQKDVLVGRLLGARVAYGTGPKVDGCREGTLDEIHELLSKLLVGDGSLSDRNASIELDYETRNLEPNIFLGQVMRSHHEAGGVVIAVSDMYLQAGHIATLVERLLPGAHIDKFYSSADYKVSKRTGLIFSVIESELAAEPDQFLMIGDSVESDYRQARRAGWNSLLLPIPDKFDAEVVIDHDATRAELEGQGVKLGPWVEKVAR